MGENAGVVADADLAVDEHLHLTRSQRDEARPASQLEAAQVVLAAAELEDRVVAQDDGAVVPLVEDVGLPGVEGARVVRLAGLEGVEVGARRARGGQVVEVHLDFELSVVVDVGHEAGVLPVPVHVPDQRSLPKVKRRCGGISAFLGIPCDETAQKSSPICAFGPPPRTRGW